MSHPQPAAANAAPASAEVTAHWRLAVLSVWHPALGAPVDPVAVAAVDQHATAPRPGCVAWVPLTFEAADPWRALLADGPTADLLEYWAEQDGTVAVDFVEVPEGAVDLVHAAGLVLDELLGQVLPSLPDRGEG